MNPRIKSPIQLGVVASAVSKVADGGAANQCGQNKFRLQSSIDVLATSSIEWCVKKVLPAQGLAAIFGPTGSGKSFLVLDLMVAIVEGRTWFGYRVKPKPVVYVALEGEAGIRNRIAAMVKSVGLPMPQAMRFLLGQPFKLNTPEDVRLLAEAMRADISQDGAVVVLDTLNRAAPGADENSSADMGAILDGAKELQRLIGGLVILVHHTGKDTSKGLRGHSSLFAALDAAVEVSRQGDHRQWKVAKAKDGEDGKAHDFELKVISLAPDQDGDPVSSCVVKPILGVQPKNKSSPQGANQKVVLTAIRPLLAAGQVGVSGAPSSTPCIDMEAAITAGGSKLTCPNGKQRTRAREAINGMVTGGFLGRHGDWLWEN